MESIKLWFQDWSDACEYANECVPDLSFLVPREPYSALASIALVCFLAWWWNERHIKTLLLAAQSQAKKDIRAIRYGELAPKLGWARAVDVDAKKKAA
jgi:hypothetical protein